MQQLHLTPAEAEYAASCERAQPATRTPIMEFPRVKAKLKRKAPQPPTEAPPPPAHPALRRPEQPIPTQTVEYDASWPRWGTAPATQSYPNPECSATRKQEIGERCLAYAKTLSDIEIHWSHEHKGDDYHSDTRARKPSEFRTSLREGIRENSNI